MKSKSIKRKKTKSISKQEKNIIEPLHTISWRQTFPAALQLLKKLGGFILGKEKIATIAADSGYDAKTYIAGYIIVSVISSLGMLLYGLLGGAKYFNNWYLFLVPFLSIVIPGTLFILALVVLYFLLWEKKLFTHKKIIYFKYLLAVYIPSQLAWLFYAVKLKWPGLNRHVFPLALGILCFMFIKVLYKQPKVFSAGAFLLGMLLLSVPYSLQLYFNPEIAAFVVRVFGL